MLLGIAWVLLVSGAGMLFNINPDNEKLERRVNKIGLICVITGFVLIGLTLYLNLSLNGLFSRFSLIF